MSVVWSILALIIAGVVCYFIYEEYIVEKPEESEAEKEIEADLMALASESGMSEFDSLPDSRKSGAAPAISVEGAAVIGETETTAEAASAAEPVAAATPAAAVAVADVTVDSDVDDAVVVEDDPDDAAADEAVADEAVQEAAATMNAVVVEEPDEEAVAVQEVAVEEVAVEEDVVVVERTVAVPLEVDDLTKIKGIGKVYAQRLNEAGITSYQQIVDTDVATLEEISKAIPAANAYDWARQARKLSDG